MPTLLLEPLQALEVAPAGNRRPPFLPFPRRAVLVGGVDEPLQPVGGDGIGTAVEGEAVHAR